MARQQAALHAFSYVSIVKTKIRVQLLLEAQNQKDQYV